VNDDVEAVTTRIAAFVDAWEAMNYTNVIRKFYDEAVEPHVLTTDDLRTLLAAIDPAEQPIGHIPTEKGTKAVLDYRALRRQQHPKEPTDA
jgi:hypothetical protein